MKTKVLIRKMHRLAEQLSRKPHLEDDDFDAAGQGDDSGGADADHITHLLNGIESAIRSGDYGPARKLVKVLLNEIDDASDTTPAGESRRHRRRRGSRSLVETASRSLPATIAGIPLTSKSEDDKYALVNWLMN